MSASNDMFADVAASPSQRLRALATRVSVVEAEIAGHEELLKGLKAEKTAILNGEMVEAMGEFGVSDMVLDDGTKFSLKQYVNGSLPKEEDERNAALDYLVQVGGAGLITTDIDIRFGRNQHNEALDLYGKLKDMGLPVGMETGVHPQTLQAFMREALKKGDEVDPAKIGCTVGMTVKVTPGKK